MTITDTFVKLFNMTVKASETIANPYEKATIYASVLNSLSRIIAANDDDKDNKVTIADTEEAMATNTVEEAVTENNTETMAETVQTVEETTTEEETSIIDQTSEDDDTEWTERMQVKYADVIEFVRDATAMYGEDQINGFVKDNTNNLYSSFNEMDPQTYLATAELLSKVVEQQ